MPISYCLLVGTVRNRIVTILFFPIFIILFTVGWALYSTGKKQTPNKKTPQRELNVAVKDAEEAEEDSMEVGLIENLNEEQLVIE